MDNNFRPIYDHELTLKLVKQYSQNPYGYDPKFTDELEKHAEAYSIPFGRDPKEYEFSLGRGIKQATEGFFEGFSTFKVGKESANEYERVMRAIGHLAGFAGIVPLSKPLKLLGSLTKSTRILNLAKGLKSSGMDKLSVPMLVADAASKKIANPIAKSVLRKTIGKRADITGTVGKTLYDPKVQDILHHSFHLGVASAASSWRGGVDEMMHSALGGAEMGAAFGLIGNIIGSGSSQGEKILRGMSGSIYQGMSAEHAGQTNPEKIYEYLLGGYFGYKALPANIKLKREFITKAFKEKEFEKPEPSAEKVEGFLELPEEVQKSVSKEFDLIAGLRSENLAMGGRIIDTLEKMGYDMSDSKVEAPEGFKIVGAEGTDVLVTPKAKIKKEKAKDALFEHQDLVSNQNKLYEKEKEIQEKYGFTFTDKEGYYIDLVEAKTERESKINDWKFENWSVSKIAKENLSKEDLVKVEKIASDLNKEEAVAKKRHEKALQELESRSDNNATEDSDIGTSIDSKPLALRAVNFVEASLRNKLDEVGTKAGASERLQSKIEASERVNDKISELIDRKTEFNRSEEFVEWFEKEFKTPLEDTQKGIVRQWLTERNSGKQVDFISAYADGSFKYLDKKNPYTDTGKFKYLVQPVNLLEKTYKELTKNEPIEEGKKPEPVVYVLDHIISNEKGQPLRENDLFRFRDNLYYEARRKNKGLTEEEVNKIADAEYNNLMDRIIKKQAEKGYYWFGGRGDAERAYFVKMHPWLNKALTESTNIAEGNKAVNNMYKVVTSLIEKDAHKKDIQMFKKRFGSVFGAKTEDVYRRMFMSNVLYDMNTNGFMKLSELTLEDINSKRFKDELATNLNKVLDKENHFIKGPIAFNKRQQIWTATGYGGSNEFINKRVKDLDNGHYKYIIAKELEGLKDLDSDIMQYVEKTDGAIVVRNDVLKAMNLDWGMPESGQNKSFIVSPNAEKGALLGKYMFHTAGAEQSKAMEKEGLHFYMYDSAAKQRGSRQMTDLEFKGGELKYDKSLTYSDVLPEHIKGNFSEKNTGHMIDKQRIPKQMLTNLSKMTFSTTGDVKLQKKAQRVIDDIFDTIMGTEYRGEESANNVLKDYIKNPTDFKLQEVERNLNNIGLEKLIEAMKMPGYEKLNHLIYKHVLRMNDSFLEEAVAEGEITREDKAHFTQELREFNSAVDRLIRIAGELTDEGSSSSIPVLMHKYVRDYRMQATRNFVVNMLARPKINNSGSVRMRPLDAHLASYLASGKGNFNAEMAKKFLDKGVDADRYFFLDSVYADLPIFTTLAPKGKMTLGEFWEKYQKGDYKNVQAEADEVLRAVCARVPMDSISGAHALTFAGFTGREGHGGLFHPRVMRALGGADLDGDKAFIFFGGRNKDGSGGGMKKEWKDLYDSNRNEFVAYRHIATNKVISPLKYEKLSKAQKKKYKETVSDNKDMEIQFGDNAGKTYREALTLSEVDGEVNDATMQKNLKSKAWYYSPYWRPQISQNASRGRQLLGPAVVNRSVINSVYAAMIDPSGKPITHEYKIGKDTFRIKPRTDAEGQELLREMGRATVALGSDPLDELGLNRTSFLNEMFKAAFEVEMTTKGGAKFKDVGDITNYFNGKTSWMTHVDSPFGKIKGINSAYYGRNWGANRRFFIEEIKLRGSKFKDFKDLNDKVNTNTFLPKLAEYLQPVDWSDNTFRRLKFNAIKDLYSAYEKSSAKAPELAKIMERMGFPVKLNSDKDNTIAFVYSKQLWDWFGRNELAKMKDVDWKALVENTPALQKAVSKNIWKTNQETGRKEKTVKEIQDFGYMDRMQHMEKLVKQAEDFLVNDMTDMVSLKIIRKHAENVSSKRFALLHEFAEFIKKTAYTQGYNRRNAEIRQEEGFTAKEMAEQRMLEASRKKLGHTATEDGKISALADQAKIDAGIKKFRKERNLNKFENKLLDHLLLSSFSRGDLNRINELGKNRKLTEEQTAELDVLKREALATRMSKVGLSSREISDSSIKEFFREYSKLFDATSRVASKEELSKVLKDVKEVTGEKRNEILEKEDVVDIQEPSTKSGLVGLIKDGKITPEQEKIVASLNEHLTHYHDSVGERLNELTRGVLNKDLNAMNFEDYKALNRMFGMLRNGRWGKDMRDAPVIKKMYYYLFPKAVDKEMMKHNFDLLREKGQFMMADGSMHTGTMAKPTQQIGKQQAWIEFGNERSVYASQRAQDELSKELLFIEQLAEHRELHELAIRERELGMEKVLRDRVERGEMSKTESSILINTYKDLYKKAAKDFNAKELENKQYTISVADKDGKTVQKVVTGREVIDRINDVYTNQALKMQKWIQGEGGWRSTLERYIRGWHHRNDKVPQEDMPIIDVQSFVRDVTNDYRKGVDIPMKYGMDGLRKVAYSLMIQTAESSKLKDSKMISNLRRFRTRDTGFLNPEHYWPHMMFDQKLASQSLQKAVKKVMENGELSEKDKAKQIQKLQLHHKSMSGEWIEADISDWKIFDGAMKEMAQNKRGEHFDFYDKNLRTGNMFSRESHIEGWSPDRPVYDAYIKNMTNTYYRQLSQIISRQSLNEFDLQHRKKWGDKLTDAWVDYIKLYAQDAMGYPSVIPEQVLKNPEMNLNGTLYAKWADNVVANRVTSIGRKLGLIKDKEGLPSELQDVDLQQIRHWSNLEAKYQMATLLAHPKSMFNNIYGGQVHTIQSTGMRNWLRGRDVAWLKANINPGKDRLGNEWNSRADVEKWVESHGIIPELMSYEFGLNPELQKGNFKKFFNEAADAIKENPSLKDGKVREIASKYNISDSVFNKAGWFMRVSERMLRRDAFMAHLVEAHQKFNGTLQMDHPYLIELAKKGVKATQFMYSAPFRPAFARTSLGKVMTRFQLWSWNSVRFRGDIIDKAAIYGYRPGTPEFERFKRLIQWDMMSIALANVFMYSLFDQGLPAPYNWLQDTADWMFGDERERDRAFFGAWPKGVAPLQMITPPIARLPLSTFQGWVNDDWSSFLDYTIYTMAPFGRMLRDVSPFNDNNIINNPIRTVDAVTGIPQMKLHKVLTTTDELPYSRGWK